MIYLHLRNGSKDKLRSFKNIGTLNTYIIYIQKVLTNIHKHVPTDKMYTYYSMNKEYMKRVKTLKSLTWVFWSS